MRNTAPAVRSIRPILLLLGLILSVPATAAAQSYTISPSPFLIAQNNAGAIINNACIWTYVAGTSTPAATYSDNIGTQNSNPIRSDSAGRFTAFLLAGSSYKYVYESACTPPAHGTVLRTADNIGGVPASAATVDVVGTAGETISAGQCAYLSDGSASKIAGQWYKCDNLTAYSSTTAEVGIATSAIVSATTGTIRLVGQVTGLVSLSTGSAYFVGTSGAITITAPSNNLRQLGFADSATTLILRDPVVPPVDRSECGGRLTLTTATPVTTADVTAAGTLFYTPYKGGLCALFDGTWWTMRQFSELSIAVPALTSQMYDVWLFDNAGTLALEVLAWTNDTTRATALTTQNGILVKTGATTRRYLGSFRTTTVANQTENSFAKRYVWNYYNRVAEEARGATETADTWTYSTATLRQANANAANQLDVIVGVAEVPIEIEVIANASSDSATDQFQVAIGEDSTTTMKTGTLTGKSNSYVINALSVLRASLRTYPAVGRHTYVWLEWAAGVGTTTWRGDNGAPTLLQSGIHGRIEG